MGVEERRDGAITVITIDRPQAHNAVDHATAVDLADAIRRFGADEDAAVLILRWGVPFFDGGTQRLPRILGLSNALWLMQTGVRIDVQRARELGFVQEVVPTGQSVQRGVELARHMAGYPQASIRSDREAILDSYGRSVDEGLALEDEARRR